MEVVNYVNVQKNMTAPQVEMAAKIIMNKHHIVDMDEIRSAFMNGCGGDYGPLYNCLDGTILTGWIDKYLASDEFTRKRKQEKNNRESPANVYETILSALSPEQSKIIRDDLAKIEEKNRRVFEMGPTVQRELSDYEKAIQRWHQQFDHLYNAQKWSLAPVRAIWKYNNVNKLFERMTIKDYIGYKSDQYNRITSYLTDKSATLHI